MLSHHTWSPCAPLINVVAQCMPVSEPKWLFFWRPFQAKRCKNIELGGRGHASFFAMGVTGWLFFWRTRYESTSHLRRDSYVLCRSSRKVTGKTCFRAKALGPSSLCKARRLKPTHTNPQSPQSGLLLLSIPAFLQLLCWTAGLCDQSPARSHRSETAREGTGVGVPRASNVTPLGQIHSVTTAASVALRCTEFTGTQRSLAPVMRANDKNRFLVLSSTSNLVTLVRPQTWSAVVNPPWFWCGQHTLLLW